MNLLGLFDFNKNPKFTIRELLSKTPYGYRVRSEDVTNITYLGYKVIIKKQNLFARLSLFIKRLFSRYKQDTVLVAWLRLYFRVESATYKNKFHTTIIEVPFRRDTGKFKLEELPVRYFCSCESFKYFIAYVLNRSYNCIITDRIVKYLGIALTKRPVIRNPREVNFFCKHSYAIISQIKFMKLDSFLKKKYEGKDTKFE